MIFGKRIGVGVGRQDVRLVTFPGYYRLLDVGLNAFSEKFIYKTVLIKKALYI